jgi:hypothetical protein
MLTAHDLAREHRFAIAAGFDTALPHGDGVLRGGSGEEIARIA